MPTPSETRKPKPPDPARSSAGSAEAALHLWTCWVLVGIQPVADLVAARPEFFLAHQVGYSTLTVGMLFLLLAGPLPLFGLRQLLVHRLPSVADGFDAAVLALAAALFLLQAGQKTVLAELPAIACLVLASACAALVYRLRLRHAATRWFCSFLAPALLVVPASFLFDARMRALRPEAEPIASGEASIQADFPIVVVLFDALSASAVMDAERRADAVRFPHLAALAADSLWYSEVLAIAIWTQEAVPSILSGRYPRPGTAPILADHPQNLFTLLAPSYRIVASEPATRLCPAKDNELYQVDAPPVSRLAVMASDLGVLFAHRTLPAALSGRLPRIDQSWADFAGTSDQGPLDQFQPFLDQIEADGPPTLYYVHVVFPHMPYVYLPSGKLFQLRPEPFPTLVPPDRREEPDLETQIFLYKRYLLQTALVDQLIGRLVERLRQVDLYDRALIVVTSDHGGRTRPFSSDPDLSVVPLLFKLPGSREVGVRSEPASNLDVLPTLVDLLGIEAPWSFDGHSLLPADHPPPRWVFRSERLVPAEARMWESSDQVLSWRRAHFGDGSDPLQLYRAGAPLPELLGSRVADHAIEEETRLTGRLDDSDGTLLVDPGSGFVPALLRGSLWATGSHPYSHSGPPILAVTIDGTIEAVATARVHEAPAWYRFHAIVPEQSLPPGRHTVQLWRVDPSEPGTLHGPIAPP